MPTLIHETDWTQGNIGGGLAAAGTTSGGGDGWIDLAGNVVSAGGGRLGISGGGNALGSSPQLVALRPVSETSAVRDVSLAFCFSYGESGGSARLGLARRQSDGSCYYSNQFQDGVLVGALVSGSGSTVIPTVAFSTTPSSGDVIEVKLKLTGASPTTASLVLTNLTTGNVIGTGTHDDSTGPQTAGQIGLSAYQDALYRQAIVANETAVSAATSYTLTPSTGSVSTGAAKTFSVTPNGNYTGTISLTASGVAGTFSAASLSFAGSNAAQTFNFTPTAPNTGTATINASASPALGTDRSATLTVNDVGRTVYTKSSWADLSDFAVVGQTPSIVNGAIRLNPSSTGSFDAQRLELANVVNADSRDVVIECTASGSGYGSGSNYGLGMGWHSLNPWYPVSITTQINTSTATPTLNLWQQATGAPSGQIAPGDLSASGMTVSTGDHLRLTYQQRGTSLQILVENLTAGQSFTRTQTFDLSTAQSVKAPNSSVPCICGLGGQFDVTSLTVRDGNPAHAPIAIIGDSKTVGYSAGSQAARWATLIDSSLGPVAIYAGNGDRTVEALQALPLVLANPPTRGALLAISRNDLQSGVSDTTRQTNYASIVTQLKAAGISVAHLLPIPETSQADQSAITSFINATYAGDVRIDPSVGWDNTADLSSDNVHPNATGHQLVANRIVSGMAAPAAPVITSPTTATGTGPQAAQITTVLAFLDRYKVAPQINAATAIERLRKEAISLAQAERLPYTDFHASSQSQEQVTAIAQIEAILQLYQVSPSPRAAVVVHRISQEMLALSQIV